jgi:hypothetical protein
VQSLSKLDMQSGFFSKQVESAPESDLDVRLDSTALEQRLHAVAIAKLLRSGEGELLLPSFAWRRQAIWVEA